MTVYANGRNVLETPGCPGFAGIVYPAPYPSGYPLLRFGEDLDNMPEVRGKFNGSVSDVRLFARNLGAPSVSLASGEAPANVLILPGTKGSAVTRPFMVLEHEGELLGSVVQADEKFKRAAATARIDLTADHLVVRVKCPVPVGMFVKEDATSAWRGDSVEFFVRPDLSRTTYFQYAVNAAGVNGAYRYTAAGARDDAWKSAFHAKARKVKDGLFVELSIPLPELFPSGLKEGDVFTVNFTRSGQTAGGASTWVPVGRDFHNPEKFGRVIVGARAYFERELAARDATKAAEAFAAVKKAIREHGDEPSAFAGIESLLANLDQAVLKAAMTGKGVVLFHPKDPWGNRLQVDSTTRLVREIRMDVPRNGKAWYPLAVGNLTDGDYLGQIKVVEGDWAHHFNTTKPSADGVARRFRFLKALAVGDSSGNVLLDPLVELPLGTVLEVGAHRNVPIWAEVDTHGMTAGVYRATLVLKKGSAGFSTETASVTVRVRNVDAETVPTDRAGYTYLHERACKSPTMIRALSERGFNVIYTGIPGDWVLKIFPTLDADGNLVPGDMRDLDDEIDAVIATGIPRERVKLWMWLDVGPARYRRNGQPIAFASSDWVKVMQGFLRQLREHLSEKYQIGPERVYLYTIDEPGGDIDDPSRKSGLAKAYFAGKTIKAAEPRFQTFVNPHWFERGTLQQMRHVLDRLAECYDVLEFYRPHLTPEQLAIVKEYAPKLKEIWTYSIIGRPTSPVVYRRDVWMNFRDGFSEFATYWHMDHLAGGDGFDDTDANRAGSSDKMDWGSLYVDYDQEKVVSSRRQLASDMGFEDAKLVKVARYLLKDGSASELESAIRSAADKGTMPDMDRARLRLFELIENATCK